jgi:hypothetical protein
MLKRSSKEKGYRLPTSDQSILTESVVQAPASIALAHGYCGKRQGMFGKYAWHRLFSVASGEIGCLYQHLLHMENLQCAKFRNFPSVRHHIGVILYSSMLADYAEIPQATLTET